MPFRRVRYNPQRVRDEILQQTGALRRSPATSWRWLALIGLIITGGCFLRFWRLGTQSLWFDEGYSAWMVTHLPRQIIYLIRFDVSPPLYYLLLHLWAKTFGESEFALRSMSAVAACLALPLMALTARRITNSWFAAIVATLVFSVSVLQVQYAQEARSYGLASMLALVAFYAMVRRANGGSWWMVLAGVATGATVWLHNMMWFYVVGLSLAYLIVPGETRLKRRVIDLVWMNALIVAAFIPWISALGGQMQWLSGNFWASIPNGADLVQVLLAVGGIKVMHLTAIGPAVLIWIAGGVLAVIGLLALIRATPSDARWALALLVYAAIPILAVFTYAHYQQSFFMEKVFTASTLAIPLLGALAVTGRGRSVGIVAVVVLLLGSSLSLWGYFQWEQKEDWRSAVAYVNEFPRDDTLVIFVANEGELLYDYYRRQSEQFGHSTTGAPQGFLDLTPPRTIQRVLRPQDTQSLQKQINRDRPRRILLVLSHTHFSDPDMFTRKLIESQSNMVSEKSFHWIDVVEFRAGE